MIKHITKILFVAVSFIFSSCNLDDGVNFEFLPLQIVSADLPDSFTLNQVYKIDVTYIEPDTCTNFERFIVKNSDTTVRNINILGIHKIDENSCDQIAQEQTASFNFIVKYTEPYTFRFWKGESENGQQQFIEVEVPVN
jgi:hypothetical protein